MKAVMLDELQDFLAAIEVLLTKTVNSSLPPMDLLKTLMNTKLDKTMLTMSYEDLLAVLFHCLNE